jgi:hypothetical protein
MTRATVNAAWHAKHRMPPGASLEHRITWHLEHAKRCACRPIPEKLRAQIRHASRRR